MATQRLRCGAPPRNLPGTFALSSFGQGGTTLPSLGPAAAVVTLGSAPVCSSAGPPQISDGPRVVTAASAPPSGFSGFVTAAASAHAPPSGLTGFVTAADPAPPSGFSGFVTATAAPTPPGGFSGFVTATAVPAPPSGFSGFVTGPVLAHAPVPFGFGSTFSPTSFGVSPSAVAVAEDDDRESFRAHVEALFGDDIK